MPDPKPGDKFTSVGTGEDNADEELTIQEVVEQEVEEGEEKDDTIFEVIAEEDGESYEIQDDGAGNWVTA